MSSNVKGIATIELKSDRFVQSADKAKRSLTNLGDSGKRSIDKIGQSSDANKAKLQTMANTGRQSMGALGQAGTRAGGQIAVGMNQATQSVNQLTLATQSATASSGIMILGIAALGTSIGTTFTGMSNLNKAELSLVKSHQKVQKVTVGLARANDLLSSTQLAVKRFTISVAKFEEQGLTATTAYMLAKANLTLQLQKLVTAQDDYKVKLADIQIAENDALQVADDLQDTYINMTISIANTGLMMLFLTKTMLPGLNKQWIINKVTMLANSRVMKFLRIDLIGIKVAITGTTLSLRGLAGGIRGVMLALGPIGIAMIAIGIAFEIWQTNAFGVQEALAELWKWLKQMIPVLSVVEALVTSIFPPEVIEEAEDLGLAVQETGDKIAEAGQQALQTSDDMKLGLLPALGSLEDGFIGVGDAASNASKQLDEFKKKRDSFSQTGSGDQSDPFFGQNGIFQTKGRLLGGFRGEALTITRPGSGAAVRLAMERFGLDRATAIKLTQTAVSFRSRILTKTPIIFGGSAEAEIASFIARSGNNFSSGARQVGVPTSIRERIARNDRIANRLATGGRFIIDANGERQLVGGFPNILAARRANKTRIRRQQADDRASVAALGLNIFGSGTGNISVSGRILAMWRSRALAPIRATILEAGLGVANQFNISSLFEAAKRILVERERVIANYIVSTGLSRTDVTTMTKTSGGVTDLGNITAFQDRIKLEANQV